MNFKITVFLRINYFSVCPSTHVKFFLYLRYFCFPTKLYKVLYIFDVFIWLPTLKWYFIHTSAHHYMVFPSRSNPPTHYKAFPSPDHPPATYNAFPSPDHPPAPFILFPLSSCFPIFL